jgi:hypothetical protein
MLTFCKKLHRKIPHRFLEKLILRKYGFFRKIFFSKIGEEFFDAVFSKCQQGVQIVK